MAPLLGDIINIYQVPSHKLSSPCIYIICHFPLVFISPTSKSFYKKYKNIFHLPFYMFCVCLLAHFIIMASSSLATCTPENEVLNFKQRGGENLKDAWYRICNAHNRSTRKQSTTVLLHNFYVGITTWYRFVLDTITRENFLICPPMDALMLWEI